VKTVPIFIFSKDSYRLAALVEGLDGVEDSDGATLLRMKHTGRRIPVDEILEISVHPIERFHPIPSYLRNSLKASDPFRSRSSLWGFVEAGELLLPLLNLTALAEEI